MDIVLAHYKLQTALVILNRYLRAMGRTERSLAPAPFWWPCQPPALQTIPLRLYHLQVNQN